MVNLTGFDASKVEPRSILPVGDYVCVIDKSERKETSNKDGWYLSLQLTVVDGEFRGKKLFDMLHLGNKNEKAVAIARQTLSAICRSVGVITPRSSSELHNKPLIVSVKHDKYNDELQERVKKYSAVSGAKTIAQQAREQEETAPWA